MFEWLLENLEPIGRAVQLLVFILLLKLIADIFRKPSPLPTEDISLGDMSK